MGFFDVSVSQQFIMNYQYKPRHFESMPQIQNTYVHPNFSKIELIGHHISLEI